MLQSVPDPSQALVSVYKKLLEFYHAAYEILSRNGANVIVGLMLDNGHLPSIVQDFLKQSDSLRKLVQKATLEIVQDIKVMLYDQESKLTLPKLSYHILTYPQLAGGWAAAS